MKYAFALLSIFFLVGCEKESRYELVKADKGFIRLDRKTGNMVTIDQFSRVSPVDLSPLQDVPVPGPFVRLGEIELPEAFKKSVLRVETRWYRGRLEYRIAVTPTVPGLRNLTDQDVFTVTFEDDDGFPIYSTNPLFAIGHEIAGPDGKKSLICYEWNPISAFDYSRIKKLGGKWRLSEATKVALAVEQ